MKMKGTRVKNFAEEGIQMLNFIIFFNSISFFSHKEVMWNQKMTKIRIYFFARRGEYTCQTRRCLVCLVASYGPASWIIFLQCTKHVYLLVESYRLKKSALWTVFLSLILLNIYQPYNLFYGTVSITC